MLSLSVLFRRIIFIIIIFFFTVSHPSVKTPESREQQSETPEGEDEGHTVTDATEKEDEQEPMDTTTSSPEDENSTKVAKVTDDAAVTPEQTSE